MQQLSQLYLTYLNDHHPDLLMEWQLAGSLDENVESEFIRVKPLFENLSIDGLHPGEILQQCLLELTSCLLPSRFDYISEILSNEFEPHYEALLSASLLPFESMNLLQHCKPVFDELNFSLENEDDPFIRYAVIAAIGDYFTREQEQVSNAVQYSTTINK